MKVLIVDERIPSDCERNLMKKGFFLIKLPADKRLGEAVGSHPDTLLFYADGEMITTAEYCEDAAYIFSDIREYKPEIKLNFTSDERSDKYPNDCKLNALVIGRKIFCKSDSISDAIKDFASRRGYEIVHTNQGYAACTVLSFGNSAITADPGLGELLAEHGINVTIISQGGISLPPYEYGFIGGASGVVGDRVYFFGNIMSHPDGEMICRAVEDAGYTPLSLSDGPLRDLGGFFVL